MILASGTGINVTNVPLENRQGIRERAKARGDHESKRRSVAKWLLVALLPCS